MGYSTFKSSPKSLTTSDQIGAGQIKAEHLDPGLYGEIKNISLHNHSGAKSRRIKIQDIEGAFPKSGFYMYDVNGTRYLVTISGGAFVLTAA